MSQEVEFVPAGYASPPKTADDFARMESVARRFFHEAEAAVEYWRQQRDRFHQLMVESQRGGP